MTDKKQYFRDVKPGEVSIEGRQSNGVTADNEGNVFIYSGLKDTELDYLAETQNKDNIPLYYGNSYVAITKSQTHNTLNLGNNNYETLNEKTDPNKIVTTTKSNDTPDCTYEFMDSSAILLNWENDNTKFGWAPYGANKSGIANGELEKAQNYFLDNYWNTNNKNTYLANYGGSNQSNPKLLISNLPPGLRIVAAQLNYSTGQWLNRILVALGPDFANAKDSNGKQLGIPYKKSLNIYNDQFDLIRDKNTGAKTNEKIYNPTKNPPAGSETIVWHSDRIQLFIDQYDEIIKYYNKNKATFLENLYQESLRFYKAYTAVLKGNENPTSESLYKDFYVEYATKARDLALKYKDCDLKTVLKYPPKDQQPQQQQQQAPPPSKEQTPPPPAPEIDQYEVESNFIYLEDESPELSPTQLTDIIIVKDNYNEPITDAELEVENRTNEEINRRENRPNPPASGKKTGSIIALIQNNTKEYGNLGDLYYHPTPLYAQGDPAWGSKTADGLSMSQFGCAYNTACMILGSATKDPNKCSPISMWNSGNKFVNVNWPALAQTAGKTFVGGKNRPIDGSIAAIDEAIKTQPVGFEWQGGTIFTNKGWDKGYNLRGTTVKISPSKKKVPSKGYSYTCCKQHWMVITGKNKDGTYTVFDPSGGVIRKNQTAEQIAAGLTRILRVVI